MSIIRSPRPEANFYILDKSISENLSLSWAARGLLIFLLGKPDNWCVSIEHLRRQTEASAKPTGRDGLYGMLDELIKAGYVRRDACRDDHGRMNGYSYHVSEKPFTAEPYTDLPDTAETTLTSTDLKQESNEPNAPSAPKQPKVTFSDKAFTVHSADLLNTWHTTYGESRVTHELAKAAAWVIATGAKKKDWARFLNNWLANSKAAAIDETGCPVDKIIDLYHEQCPAFPVVTVRDDKTLRGMIVDRWRESTDHQSGKFWQKIFSRANRRSEVFYRGQKCAPRLEAIVSRAVFRELEEMPV